MGLFHFVRGDAPHHLVVWVDDLHEVLPGEEYVPVGQGAGGVAVAGVMGELANDLTLIVVHAAYPFAVMGDVVEAVGAFACAAQDLVGLFDRGLYLDAFDDLSLG